MKLHKDIHAVSCALGVLAALCQYDKDKYEIRVWAPSTNIETLELLQSCFGGQIIKKTDKRYKWCMKEPVLDEFVDYLVKYLPPSEGRTKFIEWAKGKYDLV